MTGWLKRKFEVHVEISSIEYDRQTREPLPSRVRFYHINRWVDVPGHLTKIEQAQPGAPTLHSHTIFGSRQALYVESEQAAGAAVREYIRRGLRVAERLQDGEILVSAFPDMTNPDLGNALWYLVKRGYDQAMAHDEPELAEAVARAVKWFNALDYELEHHQWLAAQYEWPLNEDEEPYQYEPLVPASGEVLCPKCRNLFATDHINQQLADGYTGCEICGHEWSREETV